MGEIVSNMFGGLFVSGRFKGRRQDGRTSSVSLENQRLNLCILASLPPCDQPAGEELLKVEPLEITSSGGRVPPGNKSFFDFLRGYHFLHQKMIEVPTLNPWPEFFFLTVFFSFFILYFLIKKSGSYQILLSQDKIPSSPALFKPQGNSFLRKKKLALIEQG
jgi:hypothetical protein